MCTVRTGSLLCPLLALHHNESTTFEWVNGEWFLSVGPSPIVTVPCTSFKLSVLNKHANVFKDIGCSGNTMSLMTA